MHDLWSQIYTHSLFWFTSVLSIIENVPQTHCIRMRKAHERIPKKKKKKKKAKRIRILDTLTFSKEKLGWAGGGQQCCFFFFFLLFLVMRPQILNAFLYCTFFFVSAVLFFMTWCDTGDFRRLIVEQRGLRTIFTTSIIDNDEWPCFVEENSIELFLIISLRVFFVVFQLCAECICVRVCVCVRACVRVCVRVCGCV